MKDKQPIIDWEPAPGCVLVKPVKREELAALYNQSGASSLSLPDKVGKVSDSVGVGRIVKMGEELPRTDMLEMLNHMVAAKVTVKKEADRMLRLSQTGAAVGDYIAYMPYTDLLIEIDGVKYALIEYKNIRAVRKGQ